MARTSKFLRKKNHTFTVLYNMSCPSNISQSEHSMRCIQCSDLTIFRHEQEILLDFCVTPDVIIYHFILASCSIIISIYKYYVTLIVFLLRVVGRPLMFNAFFSNISVLSWWSNFYFLVRKSEFQEKTLDLSQVTDKR